MPSSGLVTRAAEALSQREDDHQRWADDGGSAPDPTSPEAATDAPATEGPFGLPVLLVYRRQPAV